VITVQLVSKPIAPPWNDATKSLAHALLSNRQVCAYRFFGTPASHVLESAHVSCDIVSRGSTRFQPGLVEHASTLLRLSMPGRDVSLYHLLFTPNRRSSTVLSVLPTLRRRPVVHTLCSSPTDWVRAARLLFADQTVTVSAWAKQHLEECGVPNVTHIPPGIDPPTTNELRKQELADAYNIDSTRPCILFPGDYEFSRAHDVILHALPQVLDTCPDAMLVFACRPKTAAAHAIELWLRQELGSRGLLPHVRFVGEVDDFPTFLSLASIVVFPVRSLMQKMDIPITLLQALALGIPIVISTYGPLQELLDEPVGLGVPPGDAEAFGSAVSSLLLDSDKRREMGRVGREMVARRYSSAAMARAYEALYVSITSGHSVHQ
jgi:glycosyltransferase involved in cell wall biosynthesis